MKPEVFVGVLLFLIAAVLAYNFGSWIGDLRDRRKQRNQAPAAPVEAAEKQPAAAETPTVATAEVLAPHPMVVAMASSTTTQSVPATIKPEPAIESIVSAPPPMPIPPSAMAPPETARLATAAPPPKNAKPGAPAAPVTRYGAPALSALAEHALAEGSSNEPILDALPKPDVKATLPPGASIAPKAPAESQPVSHRSRFDGPRPDVRATLPPADRA